MTELQSEPKIPSTLPTLDRKLKFSAFFPLLIPVILALALSFLLRKDQGYFLLWWFTLLLFGVGAFPITAVLFKNFKSRGYGFSKALGILCVSFTLWTLTYIRLTPFSQPFIIIFLLLLFAFAWGLPFTRQAALDALSSRQTLSNIALEESLFVGALFLWCVIKAMNPAINGEEKFMDFAFLNSLLRYDSLPALDPWLAGRTMNYYYYGQYIYALLTKLSQIPSGIAYNFSMCTAFALCFTMAYALGSLFMEGARLIKGREQSFIRIGAGLLSGLTVALFGNSHAFFYDEHSLGNRVLHWAKTLGINVGETTGFFYPDSTRFIGWNPDSRVMDSAGNMIKDGDYTIHEFPAYSYLLGDLHAHVISLMVVMLIIAILFVFYQKAKHPQGDERLLNPFPSNFGLSTFSFSLRREFKGLLKPELIWVAILLGIATMCNYWDFLIYFIVGSMVLLIYQLKSSKYFATFVGSFAFLLQVGLIFVVYLKFSSSAPLHVLLQLLVLVVASLLCALAPCALSRTGLGMSFLFSISSLAALSFNANFDMIANSLARTENQSKLWQFLVVWWVHLLFAVILILITLFSSRARKSATLYQEETAASLRPVGRFFAKLRSTDIFMSGLAVVAFLVLLAPELFYVRDIYGGSYKRSNTMFKFTFAAFVILSLVMAYTYFRVIALKVVKRSGYIAKIILVCCLTLLLLIPGHYPTIAIPQRSGSISLDLYTTIDGTAALPYRNSPQIIDGVPGNLSGYASGINWLNENVQGSVNICEAFGYSYTDFCVVSAYTGLPTIIGWQTHEWLWRFQGIVNEKGELVNNPTKPDVWADIITPRQTDIRKIYTSGNLMEVKGLLERYNVTYLIVGDLERAQFNTTEDSSIDTAFLQSLGEVVFEEGSFSIIKVA